MTNDEYLTAWKNILWVEKPPRVTTLPGYGNNVVIPDETYESICTQLDALKGQRCVWFIPGNLDDDLIPQYNFYHCEEHRIGTLEGVKKRDREGQMDDHLYVKVNIEDKYKTLPLRGYQLHLGLHCEHNVWENTDPKITDGKWPKSVLKSCKVHGVYWKELDNENHTFDGNFMGTYYRLRNLWMYVYEPGRCYW